MSDETTTVSVTDCRTPEGVAVGLIDGIIAMARVLRSVEVTQPVAEALLDLRMDEDVAWLLDYGNVGPGVSAPPVTPFRQLISDLQSRRGPWIQARMREGVVHIRSYYGALIQNATLTKRQLTPYEQSTLLPYIPVNSRGAKMNREQLIETLINLQRDYQSK